jgi:nitrite reductase (NO-forming)
MRLHRLITGVVLAALAAGACTSSTAPSWTFGAPATPAAVDQPNATPGAAQGTIAGKLAFEAFDLGFTPAKSVVPAAGTYEVTLTNTGTAVHDITFPDGTVIKADPGMTATGTVAIPAEGLAFICSIPGHKDAGMTGTVSVEGAGGGEASTGGDSHGGPAPATTVEADPNAPAYTLHDPKAPPLLEGEVHDIDLVIEEKEMTVAKGFVQKVWTFGGSVPGPVLRVKVGDTVRIHLKNPATSQLSHSVDFHSSLVAWNDEMTSIKPGEEKLYEFKAEFAGVWMYHCGTSPALHHIANGMYGMMIVEPREGLAPVEHEFALVQNEWYLGPQGEIVSLEKAAAGAPAPDFVTFNGIANQYLDNPIAIPTGARVRVFILDAGPSIDSSFHVVGTIFDRVIKEGVELEVGNAGNWGSQAVDLSPAQGAIVEFAMAEDGLYPIVTHAFNFVGRGALGLFQAGDGDPKN